MFLYYALIAVSIIITAIAVKNFFLIKNIEKSMENYLFIITSSKAYYIGATLFALALLVIAAYQAMPFGFDIRILSIVLFFGSIFLLSLSHLIYYLVTEKKLSDFKEFFKEFEINLNNRCEKLMLKHIYSKEKDLKRVKEIFLKNRHLCKEKK
jgi:hypothetical protein